MIDLSQCRTDEELIRAVQDYFPQCPNPNQHPKIFEWYCKLYIFYKQRKERYGIL